MPTPGVSVVSDVQRVLRGAPTNTGVLFLVGPTTAGTVGTVYTLTSIADYTTSLGARSGTGIPVYDAIETFFAEGGAKVYVSRTVTGGSPTTVTQALVAFGAAYGPGQVIAPGDTTAHAALLAHAAANNRVALLDGGGSVVINPVAGSVTNRNVAPSAAVAGLIARGDSLRSVNEAPAGDRGYFRTALDVVPPTLVGDVTTLATAAKAMSGSEYGALFTAGRFTDAERATLDEGSANPVIVGINGIQLYGFSGLPTDSFFTNARLRMALTARLNSLAQQFVFRTINDRLRGSFRATLLGELDKEFKAGQLYGTTPEDAYDVDVSDAVNTPTTIAAGRLLARAWYVPGPFAERVEITLSALPIPAATAV